jgi:hypothetical protein
VNRVLRSEIGVETDREYTLLSYEVNNAWKNDTEHHAFASPPGATDDFRYGMALNPHMKAFITHGQYDLSTPYYTSDRLRNLMRLDPQMGGPILSEKDGLTSRRRSVYFRFNTEYKMAFLDQFDPASPTECYERRVSVTPQQGLAKKQQSAGGAVLSFVVKGGREGAWRVVDGVRLISITANFGDVKTTICHPATTTHGRIAPAE